MSERNTVKKNGDKKSNAYIVTNKFVGTKSLKELLTRLVEKEIKERLGY